MNPSAFSTRLLALFLLLTLAGGSASGLPSNNRIKRLIVQQERDLADGVRYARYKTNGSRPIAIHVVTLDRTVAGNAIRVVKGKDHASSREMLRDMSERYELENGDAVLAVVNANFWAAVRNNPIGPCVIDGEVVEMTPYKQWSSAFFDIRNRIVIDTFKLSGEAIIGKRRLMIAATNRRSDSTEVVVYNAFAGETVPYVTADQIEWLFKEAQKDEQFLVEDSTEVELTSETMRQELAKAQIESSREYPMMKIRLRYLRTPGVNVPTPCQVLDCDTGQVAMPLRGCVISFPKDSLAGALPQPGDTVNIHFRTNIRPDLRFMNAVCGTPRLVRNGTADHEAREEGVTGRRFIGKNLARTAIGTDKSGNRLIMVAIEPTRRGNGTQGATLDQMAQIMRLLGAEEAMNLDGGGSTGMVVENDHVFFAGLDDPDTRPVSVGLAIVRLTHILRSRQYSR